jgi:hypothetical protein
MNISRISEGDTINTTEWLTLVLVVVTAIYSYFTYQMAQQMRESYFSERQPTLVFAGLDYRKLITESGVEFNFQVGLVLINSGKVLVEYHIDHFKVTANGVSVENPIFHNRGGFLHPGQSTTFNFAPIPKFSNGTKTISGEVEYKISYDSSPKIRSRLSTRKIVYTNDFVNNSNIYDILSQFES